MKDKLSLSLLLFYLLSDPVLVKLAIVFMNYPSYDVIVSKNRLRYEFTSSGVNGQMLKVVEYTYLTQLGVWNLGFGDLDLGTGAINDSVVSNNGDGRKVIATVTRTLLSFFSKYPDEIVIFTGSDERRTRVYRRIIVQHYSDFTDLLEITGLNWEGIEMSVETSQEYTAFLVRKR